MLTTAHGLPTMNGTIGLIILLLVGLAVLWAFIVLMTVRMLTHPPRRGYASAVARGKPGDPGELPRPRVFTSWDVEFDGGKLPLWDIEGGRVDDPAAPVVIFAHGWGDSRLGALARLEAFGACARIIAVDLPGHGDSSTNLRFTLGVREIDALGAVIAQVRGQDDGRGTRQPIILYGWSLGAGLCIAAAARWPEGIVGVVAESPYRQPWTPARNVLRLYGLPHRLTLMPALWIVGMRCGIGRKWVGFDRAEHAVRLRAEAPRCGLLVVHGVNDEICPLEDGRKIAACGKGAIAEMAGKGHNDLWSGEGSPRERVAGFVEAVSG